jgi:CubicO group peptidase (beta-lactamase class C family)
MSASGRPRASAASTPAKPGHPWRRRAAIGIVAVILAVLGVYGWAWASLDRSATARAMIWMDADVGDQERFPSRPIRTGSEPSPLPAGSELVLPAPAVADAGRSGSVEGVLRDTGTLAFLVVHEDRLVYERYFGGSDRQTLQTSFSVAKSVLSTLIGVAIDEGVIDSLDDPVTTYLPELAERDARFERITLRHLVTMSSGLR